jgi:DnaK suppressor protein
MPTKPASAVRSVSGVNGAVAPKAATRSDLHKPARRPAVAPVGTAENEPEREGHRLRLEQKKHELLESLGVTRASAFAKNGRESEEDQAAVSHEEFISVRRNSMDYSMLQMVQAALDRIARNEYGVCHDCEEEISPKRLNAIPWAAYCVRCQESHQGETVEHQTGGVTPAAPAPLQAWNW